MAITPTSAPTERPEARPGPARRYDWDKVVVGQWQNWINQPDDRPITDAEARRRYANLKNSATQWAGRNDLRVQTRRARHGRVVDLLFTPLAGSEVR